MQITELIKNAPDVLVLNLMKDERRMEILVPQQGSPTLWSFKTVVWDYSHSENGFAEIVAPLRMVFCVVLAAFCVRTAKLWNATCGKIVALPSAVTHISCSSTLTCESMAWPSVLMYASFSCFVSFISGNQVVQWDNRRTDGSHYASWAAPSQTGEAWRHWHTVDPSRRPSYLPINQAISFLSPLVSIYCRWRWRGRDTGNCM